MSANWNIFTSQGFALCQAQQIFVTSLRCHYLINYCINQRRIAYLIIHTLRIVPLITRFLQFQRQVHIDHLHKCIQSTIFFNFVFIVCTYEAKNNHFFNLTPYLAQKIDKLLYDVIEICPFFVIYSFCSVEAADSAGAWDNSTFLMDFSNFTRGIHT